MIVFKNLLSFGLTLKAFQWLVLNQTKATPLFNIIGSVQLVVCLSSIPLCKSLLVSFLSLLLVLIPLPPSADVFGKRMRSFYHRHDWLAFCKVR